MNYLIFRLERSYDKYYHLKRQKGFDVRILISLKYQKYYVLKFLLFSTIKFVFLLMHLLNRHHHKILEEE